MYLRNISLPLLALVFAFPCNLKANSPLTTIKENQVGIYLSALVAMNENDFLKAANYYRQSYDLDHQNQNVLEKTIISLISTGDITSASQLLPKIDPKNKGLFWFISQNSEVFHKLDKNNNGLLFFLQAIIAIQDNKPVTARTYLKNLHPLPGDGTLPLLNAWTYAQEGKYQLAVNQLPPSTEKVLGKYRNFNLGLLAEIFGKYDTAAEYYKKSIAEHLVTPRTADIYARFLSNHGKKAQAIATYKRIIAIYGSAQPIIMANLKTLQENGKLPKMIQTPKQGMAEALLNYYSNSLQTINNLTLQLSTVDNEKNLSRIIRDVGVAHNVAVLFLRSALFLWPENDVYKDLLAQTLAAESRMDEAIILYQSVDRSSPLYVSSQLQLSILLEARGEKHQVDDLFASLSALYPKDAIIQFTMGNIQLSRREFEAAVTYLTQAIALSTNAEANYGSMLFARGTALERLNKWPEAESDLLEAIKINPNRSDAINYLAYSWIDRNQNIPMARNMLLHALSIAPNEADIIDSLGWAYFKEGRCEEAQNQLQLAVRLRPYDPVINDHLGDIYWCNGRRLEAKFQWNHARDNQTDADKLPLLLWKIENGFSASLKK